MRGEPIAVVDEQDCRGGTITCLLPHYTGGIFRYFAKVIDALKCLPKILQMLVRHRFSGVEECSAAKRKFVRQVQVIALTLPLRVSLNERLRRHVFQRLI